MNFQKKLLSLAVVGLALSAPVAHAAIDPGSNNPGNGELFFSLWHDNGTSATADDASYVRDLGIRINDFSNATSPFALNAAATTASTNADGRTVSLFTANTLLTSFLGTIPTGANVFWNVVGNDNLGAKRFVSTAAAGTLALPAQSTINSRNVYSAIASFVGSTNTFSNTQNSTPNSLAAVNNSNTATFGDGLAYAGGVAYGTNLGGRTAFDTTGSIGAQLPFFLQYETSTTQTGNALQRQFTCLTGQCDPTQLNAYWTLDTTGNLSYNVAAVPEADTWAMFAAGLIAVGAIARRRLAA